MTLTSLETYSMRSVHGINHVWSRRLRSFSVLLQERDKWTSLEPRETDPAVGSINHWSLLEKIRCQWNKRELQTKHIWAKHNTLGVTGQTEGLSHADMKHLVCVCVWDVNGTQVQSETDLLLRLMLHVPAVLSQLGCVGSSLHLNYTELHYICPAN